jgi:hypothetical protein
MYSFLLTLEGQRLFELVGELSATVEIDHTPYQWPNGRAFSIRDLKVGRDGQRLSNTMQPVSLFLIEFCVCKLLEFKLFNTLNLAHFLAVEFNLFPCDM